MGRIRAVLSVVAFTSAVCAGAQTSAQKPVFEVASIRRNVNDTGSEFEVAPGRLHATNRAVADLIFKAYNLRPYQAPDKPEWISSEQYDVEATAERNLSWAGMMPPEPSGRAFQTEVPLGYQGPSCLFLNAGKRRHQAEDNHGGLYSARYSRPSADDC